VPSYRALAAALLGTLALAFAAVAPVLGQVTLALDVVLALAIVLDVMRARRARIEARRLWPPLLVQGSASTLEVQVSADRALRLQLRETLHPALAEAPVRCDLSVDGQSWAAWRVPLSPRRRGEHPAGPLTARVLGPWGLGWSQRELLRGEPRRVYPQLRFEGKVGRLLALAHRRELGRTPLRLQGLGGEPYGVRDYRPGDPLSRIHWKATARRGRLVTREDAWERGVPLVVLLDCGRAMMARDAGRSKLDHALAAALALARVAAGRGDRVTLIAFSDRVERIVRVRPGSAGIAHAYGALYDLEARLAEPAYDLAAEAARGAEGRRATVVVLTSVVDLAAVAVLRETLQALRRRSRTLLVNLDDPELVRLARGSPESVEEAFAKVSALDLQVANRGLGRELARTGIRAVSAPADGLAWQALSAYLQAARPGPARAER
jgi:uncharacterized protein (DUF58 family)